MQCPNCFAQLPDGSASCGYCGSQLYNEMQYNPDYSNQQGYYNQNNTPEYPTYPGYDNMNQPNQYNQGAQQPVMNQYNQNPQGMDYNQYNQYNQGATPDMPYGYDSNMYNQQTPYQAAANSPQAPKTGKSNKALIITIVAVAAVALIVGLVLIIGGGKKDKDKEKTTEVTTEEPTTTEATTTEEPTTTEATTTEATTTEEPTTTEATTEEPTTEATTSTTLTGYNGKYVLTHFDDNGELVEASVVEESTGKSLEMYIMLYNDTCLLDASGMDGGAKAYCDFTIDGNAITIDDGYDVVEGTYDEETQTLHVTYDQTNMIFTLDPGDGQTYDMAGDYTLSYGISGGTEYTLEELREMMDDSTYNMTLKVYGVICTLTAFEDGSINIASTTLETVGTDLYFMDGTGALMGEYDPDTQTITIFTTGVDLIFELGTPE